jgi:hypothetical protein
VKRPKSTQRCAEVCAVNDAHLEGIWQVFLLKLNMTRNAKNVFIIHECFYMLVCSTYMRIICVNETDTCIVLCVCVCVCVIFTVNNSIMIILTGD